MVSCICGFFWTQAFNRMHPSEVNCRSSWLIHSLRLRYHLFVRWLSVWLTVVFPHKTQWYQFHRVSVFISVPLSILYYAQMAVALLLSCNNGLTHRLEHLAQNQNILSLRPGHAESPLWPWYPPIIPGSYCPTSGSGDPLHRMSKRSNRKKTLTVMNYRFFVFIIVIGMYAMQWLFYHMMCCIISCGCFHCIICIQLLSSCLWI